MFIVEARTRITAIAAAVTLTCSIVTQAQAALEGKWEGETNNGAAIVLDVAVQGTDLTGTLTRNGESSPLSEGKVSGNTFTFKAKLGEQTEGFSGELSEGQIRIWLDRQGASRAIVLKRVKSA